MVLFRLKIYELTINEQKLQENELKVLTRYDEKISILFKIKTGVIITFSIKVYRSKKSKSRVIGNRNHHWVFRSFTLFFIFFRKI